MSRDKAPSRGCTARDRIALRLQEPCDVPVAQLPLQLKHQLLALNRSDRVWHFPAEPQRGLWLCSQIDTTELLVSIVGRRG